MAEPAAARQGGARGRLAAAWAGILMFLCILALLASRLAAGADPGLRARKASIPPRPHQILIRRIEIRRIVHHLPANVPARPSSAVSSSGGVAPWSSPAVTRAS